jgi:hypothetical protein
MQRLYRGVNDTKLNQAYGGPPDQPPPKATAVRRSNAKAVCRFSSLLAHVRPRSSAALINAGRAGILSQFFALLGESEYVTGTRGLGN